MSEDLFGSIRSLDCSVDIFREAIPLAQGKCRGYESYLILMCLTLSQKLRNDT